VALLRQLADDLLGTLFPLILLQRLQLHRSEEILGGRDRRGRDGRFHHRSARRPRGAQLDRGGLVILR
jgi:hypothetical protein